MPPIDLVRFDESVVKDAFDNRPVPVGHGLHTHPLLTFDALTELVAILPREATGRLSGDLPAAWGEADHIPRGTQSQASTVIREIRDNRSRLMVWNVEQVPAYGDLLDACLATLEASVLGRWGPLRRRMMRMFVSSPGAVTPAHLDVEHNLILQIRGRKTLTVGRFGSPDVERRELENWWDNGYRNLERLPPELVTYHLEPGTGAYLPSLAPHWTRNGGEPSLTLSIFFRTRASERFEQLQSFNARLRRLGFSPAPPGRSPRLDHIKASTVGIYDLRRKLRGRGGWNHGA
jgi:hypothetical protein